MTSLSRRKSHLTVSPPPGDLLGTPPILQPSPSCWKTYMPRRSLGEQQGAAVAGGPPSLWPEDSNPAAGYDPLSEDTVIPGSSVREKLQFLFLHVLTQYRPGRWRDPSTPYFRALVFKCLYSAMIGFDKQYLHLLPYCKIPSDDPDDYHLACETSTCSVRDRCCGHVFERGETYYRCKYVRIVGKGY